jgi:hypothetical protein
LNLLPLTQSLRLRLWLLQPKKLLKPQDSLETVFDPTRRRGEAAGQSAVFFCKLGWYKDFCEPD